MTSKPLQQMKQMTRKVATYVPKKMTAYVPNFIDPNSHKFNWMKLLFWVNIGIAITLLSMVLMEY